MLGQVRAHQLRHIALGAAGVGDNRLRWQHRGDGVKHPPHLPHRRGHHHQIRASHRLGGSGWRRRSPQLDGAVEVVQRTPHPHHLPNQARALHRQRKEPPIKPTPMITSLPMLRTALLLQNTICLPSMPTPAAPVIPSVRIPINASGVVNSQRSADPA